MVRRKEVKSMRLFCLEALPKMFADHIGRVAHKAGAAQWHDLFCGREGERGRGREELLRQQVLKTRRHFDRHTVWYDLEDVFHALLLGVEEALSRTRRRWRPDCDMVRYRQQMDDATHFVDVCLMRRIRTMDFARVPKSLRTRIVDNLGEFCNLRALILGSSPGGQWLLRGSVSNAVSAGIRQMNAPLSVFSCKHDCTPDMLSVLAETCAGSLKVVDVEASKAVGDQCVDSLLAMNNLEELHLFNTKVSDEGGAKIILGLPKLERMEKADFLCDSLAWVDYLGEEEDLNMDCESRVFLLTEFFPSQKYFFHEEWQIELVLRYCPLISKVFFIFHERCVSDYRILSGFQHLNDLTLFGGGFYADKVDALLETRGRQLTALTLMSVSKVNLLALALITTLCPSLSALCLINCDAGHPKQGDPNSDSVYQSRQEYLAMASAAHDAAQDLPSMQSLTVNSRCRRTYLSFIVNRCPNLERLSLGAGCQVDDQLVEGAHARHGLSRLREFHCESADTLNLSARTAALLLDACPRLSALGDLQRWRGLSAAEAAEIRSGCYEGNADVDTRSHQAIRQMLDMRGSDRRSQYHLMTGPAAERIRMAAQRHTAQT